MNNKIRLMHVVECAGGVDRYLRMLTSRMDRERFEQILVCSDDFRPEEYEDFVDEFVQVHEMQNALSPSKDGAAVKRVRKLIRQWKPDVVYCHSSKGGGIGMVSRISSQKAPDVFVSMAAEVVKKISKAWFVIVGDGEQREEILALAEQLGIADRLTITRWTENPIDYMKLFNQAVLLSRWEGFGLVLAEYMTLEKSIVATAVDAIPDLITDYENGLLVEPDSQEKVAAAICEIYENKELKYKLINNGKMRINAFFDISRVANEHERLIVKISGRGGIGDDRLLINDYSRLKDYKIIAAIGDERRMVA